MMTTNDTNAAGRCGSWGGIISLVTVHLLAFAMLYLVLVQIAFAFEDHYKLIGFAATERFSSVLRVSNYVGGSTWLVLCIVAADVCVVYRLARNGSRWTSAYSHTALLSIGLLAFLSIAWLIHPMVWSRPRAADAPVADVEPMDVSSIIALATAEHAANHNIQWHHVPPGYHDIDDDARGPATCAVFFDLDAADTTPIGYDIDVIATGVPASNRRQIPAEPARRLDDDELVRMAVSD